MGISINDTFRKQNYITIAGIRKINYEALEVLAGILCPAVIGSKLHKTEK
ncbi:MAG: hypothetical protein HQP61_06855 [Peptococcaceae bacterium]|nr:hypothetical protein [Candidatus Syntrophopropionicum ammoniitolerans]